MSHRIISLTGTPTGIGSLSWPSSPSRTFDDSLAGRGVAFAVALAAGGRTVLVVGTALGMAGRVPGGSVVIRTCRPGRSAARRRPRAGTARVGRRPAAGTAAARTGIALATGRRGAHAARRRGMAAAGGRGVATGRVTARRMAPAGERVAAAGVPLPRGGERGDAQQQQDDQRQPDAPHPRNTVWGRFD